MYFHAAAVILSDYTVCLTMALCAPTLMLCKVLKGTGCTLAAEILFGPADLGTEDKLTESQHKSSWGPSPSYQPFGCCTVKAYDIAKALRCEISCR